MRRRKRLARASFSPHERGMLEAVINPGEIKETFASVGGLTQQVCVFGRGQEGRSSCLLAHVLCVCVCEGGGGGMSDRDWVCVVA